MAKKRHRSLGFVPWVFGRIAAAGQWCVRHPQSLALVVGGSIVGWMLWGFAQRTAVFRLTRIYLPAQSSLKVRDSLLGTNLWELDIRTLAADLKQQQPWWKDIRVVRELPNAIRIDTIPRLPVARVRVDRWHPVDREGFILPEVADDASKLVRLAGLGSGLRVGKANADERLKLALRVAEALRHAPPLVSRRISDVNVTDARQIRLLLDDGTEVRCGSEAELSTQLDRLKTAMGVVAKQAVSVQYIDVRFKDPVVGPRSS